MSITIRLGHEGSQVRALQKKLIALGKLDPVAVDGTPNEDGVFGRITEQAVREFQKESGLQVDGLAGRATLAALELPVPAVPDAAPKALQLFTDEQRLRLAEKLDALVPNPWFDVFDDALFLWMVRRMEEVLVENLPQPLVKMLNDLSLGVVDTDALKERLTQLINRKVNLWLVSESVEKKMFSLLIDVVVESLQKGRRLKEVLGC